MIDIEDEEFLSQVAAAEAEAINSTATKRRKVSQFTTSTTTTDAAFKAQNQTDVAQEGAYLAALRGSKSPLFHQLASNSRNDNNINKSISNNFNNTNGGGEIVQKECPCKLSNCRIFTATTAKNYGRQFYTCPQRPENGGCGFFEWCDNSSGSDDITFKSQTNTVDPSVPELPCPCGAGSCLTLTAKSEKNNGRKFYKCPAGQGGCNFFKWCDEQTNITSVKTFVNTSQTYQNTNKSYNTSTLSCFKCGKEGHWAKDCEVSSSISPAIKVGTNASTGTCYKCNKPGHWAKDCVSNSETKRKFSY